MKNKRKLIYVNGGINLLVDVDDLNERKLFRRQGGRCFFCGVEMKCRVAHKLAPSKGYTRDHLFPKSKNNPTKNNIVLSCFTCNNAKSDRNPTQAEISKYMEIYNGIIYSGGIKMRDVQKQEEGNGN